MGYNKIVFEDEDYDTMVLEVNTWKTEHPSYQIISETITKNGTFKDTIIYAGG